MVLSISKIKIFIVVVILCITKFGHAQLILTVTNQENGHQNSLDVLLKEALNIAGKGESVTLQLDAPGLISIVEPLPPIMLDNGILTIESAPNASAPQGIMYEGPLNEYRVNYGFYIGENREGNNIKIKNLTIKSFNCPAEDFKNTRVGIYIDRGTDVIIESCVFENNRVAVYCNNEKNVSIKNNILINNGIEFTGKIDTRSDVLHGAIIMNELDFFQETISQTNLYNNSFSSYPSVKLISPALLVNRSAERRTTNKEYIIRKNIVQEQYSAITIQNCRDYFINPDPRLLQDKSFDVKIDSNDLRTAYNLTFYNPMVLFQCNRNQLKTGDMFNEGANITIINTTETYNSSLGLFLVGPNNINQSQINGENIFSLETTNDKYFSVITQGAQNTKIIGINLPASAMINGNYAAVFRESKIKSTTSSETPILSVNYDKTRIPTPKLEKVYVKEKIAVSFYLPQMLEERNQPYVVDLYLSNANGDIENWVGAQTIDKIGGDQYFMEFDIPQNSGINNNSRFAIILSSLGNIKESVPLGSSNAVFTTYLPPCCMPDFTNTLTGLYPPCENIIIPFSDKLYIGSSGGTLCPGSQVNFDISNFVCPAGSSIHYEIDWGDNTTSTGPTASHTYNIPGIYYMFVGFNDPVNPSCDDQNHNYIFVINVRKNCCPEAKLITNGMARSEFPVVNCPGQDISFFLGSDDECWFNNFSSGTTWDFGDGTTASGELVQHSYTTSGMYTVTATIPVPNCDKNTFTTTISVNTCQLDTCANCIGSFAPIPDKKYIIGAWVSEDEAALTKTTFDFPQVFIDFTLNGGGIQTIGPFTASGKIIDNWQRLEKEFTVPANATSITIRLASTQGDCFFDDIRVFPKDGSMKGYVYDPVNLRLVAELDERNYATFYEYDEEGKLTRVKKETERGIMTIKEAKNSLIKREN